MPTRFAVMPRADELIEIRLASMIGVVDG